MWSLRAWRRQRTLQRHLIDADVANICKEMRESATKLLKAPAPEADSVEVADAEDDGEFEEEAAAG